MADKPTPSFYGLDDHVKNQVGDIGGRSAQQGFRASSTVLGKCSQITDGRGRFVLPIVVAICKIDLLPVRANPTGAVAIKVAQS